VTARRPRYDAIGTSYAQTRREDPRIADRLAAALGEARTVVNVGAGAGSYEPPDRYVIALEPSAVMIAQRGPDRVPAIQCSAGRLPLLDDSVDAAMAIITIHHWDDEQEAGVRELRRVARGPVVIVTYDPRVSGRMWLMADYLPEVAALDDAIFPLPERVAAWLGAGVAIEPVPIHRDTPDWMLGSFWAHPERVLDPVARAGTSGFQRMDPAVVDRVVRAVERDLADGTWVARHGHLRELAEYDAGLRLVYSSGKPT
jgi:SAM-dependent methyltransferase